MNRELLRHQFTAGSCARRAGKNSQPQRKDTKRALDLRCIAHLQSPFACPFRQMNHEKVQSVRASSATQRSLPGLAYTYTSGYIQYTLADIFEERMAHVVEGKQKLLNRVRRLRGQIDALERALDAEQGCNEVMRLLTTARGAINGIMAEVVEDHILMHMIDADRKRSREEQEAADELLDVLRSYIK